MCVAYRSPANLLASLFLKPITSPLVLLTGASGSGKTTICQKLVEQARTHGVQPAGLISPAIFVGKAKVGIALLDVASGERRLLSSLRQAHASPLCTETWAFDPRTLDWGNAILAAIHDCSLLILDELGPLELERGQGLLAGLELLDARRYDRACVVVRPSLLAVAQARWQEAQVVDCTPTGFEAGGTP